MSFLLYMSTMVGIFTWDPQKYMKGTIDQVENCDLDRWSKVEIKSIYRDLRYTTVDRLWFKMLDVNPEHANFH